MLKAWLACSALIMTVASAAAFVAATPQPAERQQAATCSCGCGGTPRPACAHSCGGTPCTGAGIQHSRIIAGEVVEGQPATVTLAAPNGGVLRGFVIETDDGRKVTTDDKGQAALALTGRRTVKASVDRVTTTNIRVISTQDAARSGTRVPRFASAGYEVGVTHAGHFDGQAANTTASVGQSTCQVLFESPHQAIIRLPSDTPVGSSQLRIVDGGRTLERPLDVVRLLMNADKTKLGRGESTQGRVVIEGAGTNLVGGVVRLQNMSTEIIELRLVGGGGSDKLEKRIDAGMIKDGRIEIPLAIRGRRGGSFSVVGVLYDPQGMTSATCSCGCGGTPRPACAHSCGGNPCTGAGLRR